MEKDERIDKEYKKLKRLFRDLPTAKKKLTESLIQNAAFIKVTLDDLQISISQQGFAEEYQNGENQKGRKATPELTAYNNMIKNYSSIIEKLEKMLPKESGGKLKAFLDA